MLFGERLSLVRKQLKVSQDELAKRIGKHAPLIGRYERGEVKPSIDVAVQIAQVLGVSLDYLTGINDVELNQELTSQITELQQLEDAERKHILKTLASLTRDAKARKAYS